MNLKELIALYRAQSGDDNDPYFCEDPLLTLYANEAQVEACRRGQLLVTTSRVELEANKEVLKLDPAAIKVMRAFVNRQPVSVLSVQDIDALHPGWQFDSPQPQTTHLVSGVTTGALHLWPCPSAQAEVLMTVQSLPNKRLCTDRDTPEIRPEAHAALVDWMLYRAYSREDNDLYNDAKAVLALRRFETEFGTKASARNEELVRSGAAMMPGPIA
jgi:hypothetical protein